MQAHVLDDICGSPMYLPRRFRSSIATQRLRVTPDKLMLRHRRDLMG